MRIKQLNPIRIIAMLFIATMAITACSTTPKVDSDYDTSFDFASLRTYQWAPNSGSDSDFQSLYGRRVENAIDSELALKGHIKVKANPDYLVTYHVSVENKVDIDTYYDTWGVGYRPYWRYGYGVPASTSTHVREYKEGTLVVDIIDPKGKQVVWRGSASSTVNKNNTPEERTARIQAGIASMLAGFPPTNEG